MVPAPEAIYSLARNMDMMMNVSNSITPTPLELAQYKAAIIMPSPVPSICTEPTGPSSSTAWGEPDKDPNECILVGHPSKTNTPGDGPLQMLAAVQGIHMPIIIPPPLFFFSCCHVNKTVLGKTQNNGAGALGREGKAHSRRVKQKACNENIFCTGWGTNIDFITCHSTNKSPLGVGGEEEAPYLVNNMDAWDCSVGKREGGKTIS